jgi:hypothetical protein
MSIQVECPVNFVVVNENKVRLNAFWVLLLSILYLFTNWLLIPIFLTIDFYLRGFDKGKYSVLAFISEKLIAVFKTAHQPIDQAPKLFAAKIGLFFCIIASIAQLISFSTFAFALMATISFFALLESVFKICAGCYAYTFYSKLIH